VLHSGLPHSLRHGHTYQTPVPLSITSAAIQSPCLPLQLPYHHVPFQLTHSVHTTSDVEPTTLCGHFAGLMTAYVSDTSLHHFVTANKERQAAGQPKQQLLQTGEHLSMLFFCTRKAAPVFLYSSQTWHMSSGNILSTGSTLIQQSAGDTDVPAHFEDIYNVLHHRVCTIHRHVYVTGHALLNCLAAALSFCTYYAHTVHTLCTHQQL